MNLATVNRNWELNLEIIAGNSQLGIRNSTLRVALGVEPRTRGRELVLDLELVLELEIGIGNLNWELVLGT